VQSRVTYYNVSGVPSVRMDGNVVSGSPSTITQTNINTRQAVASAYAVNVSKTISGNTLSVRTAIRKLSTTTIALQAHVVVVEREIQFLSPPGSNGEKEFNNVMKQMLPNANGTAIAASLAVGDSVVLNHSWVMANVYNVSNIEVVAFLQNDTTREVFQGAYTGLSPSNGNDGSLSRFVGSTANPNCANSLTPSFRLYNAGNSPITSAVISYTVNGGAAQLSAHTLNLPLRGSVTLNLPAIPAATGSNGVSATIQSINGTPDSFMANNLSSFNVNYAPPTVTNYSVPSNNFQFEIATDRYGDEITWSVINISGTTLYSGGPYTFQGGNGVFVQPTTPMTLPLGECVQLRVQDSYGDGMCCQYGNGYFRLRNSANAILFQGGSFASVDNRFMNLQSIVQGMEDNRFDDNMEVYPNPTNGMLYFKIRAASQSPVQVQIYNTLGAIQSEALLQKPQDVLENRIDMSTLENGVYFVHFLQDGKRMVRRVVLHQ
jgi:hypothetical protein